MLLAIDFFYRIYPNYGVAIILLTVAIKLVLHPLTAQSLKQMSAIQKIQPKIKELQAKFKDNPKELQQRTMELYQTEKVNPLGGCLPSLLQLPVFIALFFAIQKLKFTGAGTAFLWIADISQRDPFNILVVLIALSTYWAQKTMPQSSDNTQRTMMMIMPLMMAFVSAPFPAGLQIFWLAQTVITAAQQAYIMSSIKKEEVKA
jgi:YidC/Oxa1 family membrane protein insertase